MEKSVRVWDFKTACVYYRKNGNKFVQFELRTNDGWIKDISPRGFKYSKLPLEIETEEREEVNDLLLKGVLERRNFGWQVDLNRAKREGRREAFLADCDVFQI